MTDDNPALACWRLPTAPCSAAQAPAAENPQHQPAQDSDGSLRLAVVEDDGTRKFSASFDDLYEICFIVGRGSTANVYAARRHDSRSGPVPGESISRLFACKVVPLDLGDASSVPASESDAEYSSRGSSHARLQQALGEAALMMDLRHPNIVEIFDVFVERTAVTIVTRLMTGGDLASVVAARGQLPEQQAKLAIRGILRAVSYMHARGIAHRDLKLENVLLPESHCSFEDVQIADFGMTKALPSARTDNSICGSPLYIAPEMLVASSKKEDGASSRRLSCYGLEVDLWSCGVMLYILLSGHPPFNLTRGLYMLFRQIRQGDYSFPTEMNWLSVSAEAKDLVVRMLCVCPGKRITADEALNHPWLAAAPSR